MKKILHLFVCLSESFTSIRSIGLYIFCLSYLACITAGEAAEGPRNILILNSNKTTQKYALAQEEFKAKLKEVNWVEIDLGKDEFDKTDVKKAIREQKPDLIYCIGSKAYALAHNLDDEDRTIFSSAINWQRLPMGENTYGISSELPPGMRLMTYRYFFPGLRKIGVLYSKAYNAEWLESARKAAQDMGIEIVAKSLRNSNRLESALEELLPKVDALWLISDPVVLSDRESVLRIFEQSDAMKKPVLTYNEVFSAYGALLVIEADIPTIGEQASMLALDILSDKKITNRVQPPAGSRLILNMKKIREYGIELNEEAIGSVNRIIK